MPCQPRRQGCPRHVTPSCTPVGRPGEGDKVLVELVTHFHWTPWPLFKGQGPSGLVRSTPSRGCLTRTAHLAAPGHSAVPPACPAGQEEQGNPERAGKQSPVTVPRWGPLEGTGQAAHCSSTGDLAAGVGSGEWGEGELGLDSSAVLPADVAGHQVS